MSTTEARITVYVIIPDNHRAKGDHGITVRTRNIRPTVKDAAVIPADLSLKAARKIAKWVAAIDANQPSCEGYGDVPQ